MRAILYVAHAVLFGSHSIHYATTTVDPCYNTASTNALTVRYVAQQVKFVRPQCISPYSNCKIYVHILYILQQKLYLSTYLLYIPIH